MSKRLSTVQIAAINVTAHPHPPGRYLEIFKAAFELKRPIDGGRGLHYVLSSLGVSESAGTSERFIGTIARFTQLDPTAPWFDTTTLVQAGPDQVRKINIPDGLRPNYSSFSFFFLDQKASFFV